MRSALSAIVFCLVCASLSGCSLWDRLRDFLHGGGMTAGLRVEVEPRHGISIYLDKKRVARKSPFQSTTLAPGRHFLKVRAMGFHDFEQPLTLAGDRIKVVRVALRKRPPPVIARPAPSKAAKVPQPPKPPPSIAPSLPPGVEPIALRFAAVPETELRIDGVRTDGHVMIDRVRGQLKAGDVKVQYRVGGRDLLFITLPDDTATWLKDERPIASGTTFQLSRGVVKLDRMMDHDHQAILLRR